MVRTEDGYCVVKKLKKLIVYGLPVTCATGAFVFRRGRA